METPITKLLSNENELYIKRDDLFPFSFGGNKARKAVNFFKEIDAGSYDSVVTYGSGSSNHCRVVSNMAAARGMKIYIISPEEAAEKTFNSQMMELFGAEITIVPVIRVHDAIENKIRELREQGLHSYFIAGGGHGNLGTQAYVDAYDEIRDYESKEKIKFDYIFFASGTGTTQAGLVCGQLLHKDKKKIVGISIARKNPNGRQVVLDSIHDYLEGKDTKVLKDDINSNTIFLDKYTGNGYGLENEKIRRTIADVLKYYGIPLDSTYTGKAFTGMLKYIEENAIRDKKILFIHTGGTPLFFDDMGKRL